jgi:hypothetical protein
VISRKALIAEIRAQRFLPFEWSKSDCLAMAGAMAARILGEDPTEPIRKRYHDETSSKRVMVEEGWRSMGDVAGSLFARIPVAWARVGDWAHVRNEDGTDGLGVVAGDVVFVKMKSGCGFVPLLRAEGAFRVE